MTARPRPRTASTGTLPFVQGLRAVAVVLVVAFHAGAPLPGGYVGVDVFFVISGFVITRMLMRERNATGSLDLPRFYGRRFKRLMPALAVVVVITLVASILLLSPLGPQQTTAATGVGALMLVANVVIARTTGDYFDAPAESNALLHTWSLSVEEQFYLLFPVLLLIMWRRRPGRSAAVMVAVVTLGSFILTLAGPRAATLSIPDALVGFYGPATRVWEFGAGALLALLGTARLVAPLQCIGAAVLGVVLLAYAALGFDRATPFPSVWTLAPVLGSVALIAAAPSTPWLAAPLSSRPMVWLGDRSYSIYLWHWPAIVLANASFPTARAAAAVAAAGSFAIAAASFRWVEEPLRRMALPRPRRLAALVALTTVPAVALAAAVVTLNRAHYGSTQLRRLAAATTDLTVGCHDFLPLSRRPPADCTWNAAATGAPVYLVGDSHAKHLSAGLIAAGSALGRPVVVSTASNCPLLDAYVAVDINPQHLGRCRDMVEGTLAYLDSAPAGTVVLGQSDGYWRLPAFSVGSERSALTDDPAVKMQLAPQLFTRTVQRLRAAGHDVVLVHDVPWWSDEDKWDSQDCTMLVLLQHEFTCPRDMTLTRAQGRQGAVRRVLTQVAAAEQVSLWDPLTILCPDGICRTSSGSVSIYRDSNHLSVEGSTALADWFRGNLIAASGSGGP